MIIGKSLVLELLQGLQQTQSHRDNRHESLHTPVITSGPLVRTTPGSIQNSEFGAGGEFNCFSAQEKGGADSRGSCSHQGSRNASEAVDADVVSTVEVQHVPEASSTVDHEE